MAVGYGGVARVGAPARVHGLVADRGAVTVLLGPQQRSVLIAGRAEVAAQQRDQLRVVEQDGAAPAAFAEHADVLVVAAEVEVFDMQAERFSGAQRPANRPGRG